MEIGLLIKGLVIGFSIAAPVGPIGILCIRRSLYESPLSGLLTGLGAATADALYGCIAGFGLTFISSLLIRQKLYLHIIGGVFLCYLGVNTLLRKPGSNKPDEKSQGLIMSYVSAVFLTLTNPMTILSFAAVFAGLGLTSAANGYRSAALLVSGVFLGSAFWWLILTGGVSVMRERFNMTAQSRINQVSGFILLGFGVWAIGSLFF